MEKKAAVKLVMNVLTVAYVMIANAESVTGMMTIMIALADTENRSF